MPLSARSAAWLVRQIRPSPKKRLTCPYALALRRLLNQQQREPFAARFGSGTASLSEGQFFQAAGFGRDASRLNAHYGQKPGFKVHTYLSDRYGPSFTKLIAATASEPLHVLDALISHESEMPTGRHQTGGGGDSDHVFALCSLLGFQFAPRIPDLMHRRLYSFGKPSDYPTLEPIIGGRINLALIRAHWKAILRIVASIRTGTVTASVIMRQLAAYPRRAKLPPYREDQLRQIVEARGPIAELLPWAIPGLAVSLDQRDRA